MTFERGPARIGTIIAWTAAACTVALQIVYPLTDDPTLLRGVTIATVLSFCVACLAHAAATGGRRAALAVLIVGGGTSLVAEVIGVRTGIPFGEYRYARSLGPGILGVPLVVPLAWVMMAYPCLVLARRLTRRCPARWRRGAAIGLTAWTLTAWDVFLDPQMVAAEHWTFADPVPGLPGTHGVPLTNLAGWLLVSTVVAALLHSALPAPPDDRSTGSDEGVIAVLLGWTWLGSALANVAFFGRPAVAAWGGLALGLPVAAYLASYATSAAAAARHDPPGSPEASRVER